VSWPADSPCDRTSLATRCPDNVARRIDSGYLEYLFAVVLTIAILVGIKVIGALLVEALVVVPAAAARNLARSTRGYLAWSVVTALGTGVTGWVGAIRALRASTIL